MYNIYTKKEYSFIPSKIIIIRNKHGYLWLADHKGMWIQNSTTHKMIKEVTKDKDVEKVLKLLVKNIKNQITMYDYNVEEQLKKQAIF